MSLTPEQIDEMAKRAEAATPGPWTSDIEKHGDGCWTPVVRFGLRACFGKKAARANAALSANAITDIPALIADLRAARELLQKHALYYVESVIRPAHGPESALNACTGSYAIQRERSDVAAFLRGGER